MSIPRPRVLVTRPEPGASATTRRLVAAGFAPLVLPLSRVAGLGGGDFPGGDAVAATSANAVRFADASLLGRLLEKSFFAVGASTARAARDAGFAEVRDGAGDAAALARLVAEEMRGARLVYLCGRVRRPDFEAVLRANAIAVAAVETYDTEPVTPPVQEIARLGPEPVDAVLVTSVLGAQAFGRLLGRGEAAPLLGHARAFALSARIAAALPSAVASHVAARPDEESLLAALREWFRA